MAIRPVGPSMVSTMAQQVEGNSVTLDLIEQNARNDLGHLIRCDVELG